MHLRFRPLTLADYPLMLSWLQRPHVKAWWNDGDDSLAKVAAHYGADDGTGRYLLLADGLPIGYFQHYAAADAIGIDQFIGEPAGIGRGIGPLAIRAFVRLLWRRFGPTAIVLDPQPDNQRAIRCYEKVGFTGVGLQPGHTPGTQAYLMRLTPATIAAWPAIAAREETMDRLTEVLTAVEDLTSLERIQVMEKILGLMRNETALSALAAGTAGALTAGTAGTLAGVQAGEPYEMKGEGA